MTVGDFSGANMIRSSHRPHSVIVSVLALIVIASGVLLRPVAPATAAAWEALGPAEPIRALAVDADGRTLYVLGRTGLWRGTGGLWSLASQTVPDGWSLAHPSIPGLLAAGGPQGPLISRDGGSTWAGQPAGSWSFGPARSFAFDPSSPSVWYAGTSSPESAAAGHLLRTQNAGATWETVYDMPPSPFVRGIGSISVSPADPRVLYAGTVVYHGGGLLRSTDGGASWQSLPAPSEPLFFPVRVVASPTDSQSVLALWQAPQGAGARLHVSSDGGQTWEPGAGLPTGAAFGIDLLSLGGAGYLVALGGAEGGVFRSDAAGRQWSRVASFDGLPAGVTGLAATPGGYFAATSSGVYRWPVGAAQSGPDVAPRFAAHYEEIDGLRLLGNPITGEITRAPMPRQFFEKGLLEDHMATLGAAGPWGYMYGLLVDELQATRVNLPVGGDRSTVTYATINDYAAPELRSDPSFGGNPGLGPRPGGGVFIPYTPDLSPAPGHIVPNYFWAYLNRDDLFPNGWLHDVGLPMTGVMDAVVDKGDARGRRIKLQAFQRTVLTYDPFNPPEWQIERANVGTDYLKAFPIAGR